MNATNQLEDLERASRTALEEAYRRGFHAGQSEMKGRINAALTVADLDHPIQDAPQEFARPNESIPETVRNAFDSEGKRGRAPKGLIDTVLSRVLSENPGMAIDEVERAVLACDDRVAVKSVYNRLRHFEKTNGAYCRDREQRWYRRGDLPMKSALNNAPPPTDPELPINGSVGGPTGTQLPLGAISARAPAAAGEVGGE